MSSDVPEGTGLAGGSQLDLGRPAGDWPRVLRGLLVGLVLGCASLPKPSAADAVRAQARWSDASLASLKEGRHVYARRCSGCHALPMPSAKTEAEWTDKMDEMAKEAKLTPRERQLVEQFVLTMRTPSPTSGG